MRKYIPGFALVSFIIFALSSVVYILARSFTAIADFLNATLSHMVRVVLSFLTYIIPFSFFELFVILSPLILITLIVLLVKKCPTRISQVRAALSVLAVLSLVFTSYIYTLGVGYHTTALADRIGIEDPDDISPEQLYYVASKVADELLPLSEAVTLEDGQTRMTYSVNELSRRLIDAYDKMNSQYGIVNNFSSRVKPVYFSTVMSDLGITGIYSFFTGEANVNVEYPDYNLPYTAAHELAHQRGIGRENEANFVAFLVCISSDDEYIRYSGYLNMYEYLSSALYRSDKELYTELYSRLNDTVKADMRASTAVYNKHKDSVLGKINDKINDAYLKANGTDGVVSYGYVVRLAVGYYCD